MIFDLEIIMKRSDSGMNTSQTKRIEEENVKRGHGPGATYTVDTIKVARGAEDSIVFFIFWMKIISIKIVLYN